ncbi:hypothetical protein GMLC_39530 [Geomonas limicola]|uniref:histidine kinase n=1 Tax=Geomonas limicola TaxID=2740186 RepID=A0A6V8NEY7_9BACT|nr:HAMP domain-containing sensor histidine kinase [Geomonas limicola]GFO70374.1 hypothetical protein GMLC_39530 [Geomonas limicola]
MSLTETAVTRGLAVICDDADTVDCVLKNDFSLATTLAPGDLVTSIFDDQNQGKALQFFHEARSLGAAFDWELVVCLGSGPVALHCAAATLEGGLLVIVAGTRDSTFTMIEELLRINNEQTNSMRILVKDLQVASRRLKERDRSTYDAMTTLNSQMASMQRELIKKNRELAELNQQKNYLLGMASHDLRTPLNSIALIAQYLQTAKGNVLDQETLEMVDAIRTSSKFMATLIDDLLDLTKIEAGNLELHRTRFALLPFLDKVVQRNATLAHSKQIAIVHQAAAEVEIEVHWDAIKIEQVLNNILGNAVKFSSAGSTVTVSTTACAGTAVIEVRDEGTGMSAAELERIFTPFAAGKEGTGGEKSTGLGLAIARRIVEGHGGTIDVISAEKVGTTFTITLPV